MRHARIGVALVFAMLMLAACTDTPTAPDGGVLNATTTGASMDVLLDPIIVIGQPKECDPWLSANWCEDPGTGQCMTGMPGDPSDPELITINNCPPTGGGEPGPIGGQTGPYQPPACDPAIHPDCEKPLTAADTATINRALRDMLRTTFTDATAERQCSR